jgi:hypothetical protein
MTKSEHEKERRAFWDACFSALLANHNAEYCAKESNEALVERDKRFPAPESEG